MTVDKNNFVTLLQHYAESSLEEAEEIVSLKLTYPYSQLLRTLSAKVSKDHNLENHQTELQMAAVHAADRSVLKEIISSTVEQPVVIQPAIDGVQTDGQSSQVHIEPQKVKSVDGLQFDVADEVMRDLEKLNSLKNNFEMLFVEYSEIQAKPGVASIAPSNGSEQSSPPVTIPKEKSKKSKKERIIALAKSLNAEGKSANSSNMVSEQTADSVDGPSDDLIEEIRISKLEITPENEKQKEQIALINHFIKTQPSITNSKDRSVQPIGDLNPIKSGEFGDNIVSETLVEILIKQGKKDKAIEVLKKLIWKYPQKKAYFASQIEDLKK